jgi:hypothetical protein
MAVSFLALGTLTEIPQKTRRLLAILSKFGDKNLLFGRNSRKSF